MFFLNNDSHHELFLLIGVDEQRGGIFNVLRLSKTKRRGFLSKVHLDDRFDGKR